MNRNRIKSAYDTMSPDETARQRMLERIMEQGGHNVKKEYVAHPQKSRGWLGTAAAIVVLVVLVAGVVTMLNRNAPNYLEDDPSGETTNALLPETIAQFKDTAFYQAAVEYYKYSLLFSGAVPNPQDRMTEIANNHGLLTYTGDDRGTDDYSWFLEELGIDSILREDASDVTWEISACWYYDQTRFNVAGTVSFEGETPVRATPLDFNFYRTTPDYLLPACCEMGPLENYETWLCPLPSGDAAILAMGSNRAYVIVCRTEEIFFVEVTNWIYLDSEPAMTREAVEAVALLFDYDFGSQSAPKADWGVSLVPTDVSRTGATAIFRCSGTPEGGELSYGEFLSLERLENGTWVTVNPVPGYIDPADNIPDDVVEASYSVVDGYGMVHEWQGRFGELSDGYYRMGKLVTLTYPDGTTEEQIIYGEFNLPTAGSSGPIPLEELPKRYSAEQAELDGCFVQRDGEASANQNLFVKFAETSWSGQPAYIRIVHWFYNDESFCAVYDLNYDGRVYTITWLENGQRQTREYLYLQCFFGEAENESAEYDAYEHYVLVNDRTATWQQLWQSLASSQYGAAIDHITLCSTYMYRRETVEIPHDVERIDLEFQGKILFSTTDFDRLEKICLLFYNAEVLGYEPKTHSIGVGLNLILTTETGETLVVELDPDDDLCRVNGEYVWYGKPDEPSYVSTLWYYLGIEAWPDEVYEAYPDAYRE